MNLYLWLANERLFLINIITIYNDRDFLGGDWAIISIDGSVTKAKIVHKGWGKYIIIKRW